MPAREARRLNHGQSSARVTTFGGMRGQAGCGNTVHNSGVVPARAAGNGLRGD